MVTKAFSFLPKRSASVSLQEFARMRTASHNRYPSLNLNLQHRSLSGYSGGTALNSRAYLLQQQHAKSLAAALGLTLTGGSVLYATTLPGTQPQTMAAELQSNNLPESTAKVIPETLRDHRPLVVVVEKITRTLRLIVRALYLMVCFTPIIVSFPFWYFQVHRILWDEQQLDKEGRVKQSDNRSGTWWVHLLCLAIECAGSTFVKIGQYASSRMDMFPPMVCHILSKLQDRCSPHSIQETRAVVRSELGKELEDLFEEFDEKPVGVGAIAQVHRAKLKQSNQGDASLPSEYVAVKVLHRGVEDLIELDLTLIQTAAQVIDYLFQDARWLSLPEEVATFSEMMKTQTNLRIEGANLLQFRKNFANATASHPVYFPKPYMDLTAEKILVEELIDAVPITKFLTSRVEDPRWSKDMAHAGIRAFLKMLLTDNFVHADLHPGNILVRFVSDTSSSSPLNPVSRIRQWFSSTPSTNSFAHVLPAKLTQLSQMNSMNDKQFTDALSSLPPDARAELVFIDAGLASRLSFTNLMNLNDLLAGVVSFDGPKVAELLVLRSVNPSSAIDTPLLEERMTELLNSVKQSSLRLSSVSFSGILTSVFNMVRRHHVKLEGEFVNVGVALILVEGIGRKLDPEVDLLGFVLPFLIRKQLGI